MKIEVERVGDTVLVTVEDGTREVTIILERATAERLGLVLIAQATKPSDGLDLPEELRR